MEKEKDYTIEVSGFESTNSITIKWFFSSDYKNNREALKEAQKFFESTKNELSHFCTVFLMVHTWEGGIKSKKIDKYTRCVK